MPAGCRHFDRALDVLLAFDFGKISRGEKIIFTGGCFSRRMWLDGRIPCQVQV
jgi:hypothetical protein